MATPDLAFDQWTTSTRTYTDDWTGRSQGVAVADGSWFVTSNDGNPGLFRYSADFSVQEAQVDIPRSVAGHVGAVAIHDEVVYVALETPQAVATYTLDLEPIGGLVVIDRPVESDDMAHLAWCAINPVNGLLYTCDWNFARRLDAYDPATGEARPDADIELSRTVNRVQGGVFTSTGTVLLASDDFLTWLQLIRKWLRLGTPARTPQPGVHAFGSDGADLGCLPIRVRVLPPYFEELEGIGLGPMMINGTVHHVHVSLLDRNFTVIDDSVDLISYAVPDPAALGY